MSGRINEAVGAALICYASSGCGVRAIRRYANEHGGGGNPSPLNSSRVIKPGRN